MHRRPLHKHHGGLWEFPGGKVEAGETPGNALVREIGEELGVRLSCDVLEPVGFAQTGVGSSGKAIVILLYKARDWDGDPRALEQGAEIAWCTVGEIFALPRPPLDIALCHALFAGTLADRSR